MSEKKLGRIKFFNHKNNFGYLIDMNRQEHKVTDKNFNGPPVDDDKVYYVIKRTNKGTEICDIESFYAHYFKNAVLDLENQNYDEFCDNCKDYATILQKNKVTTSQIRKIYSQIYRAKSALEIKHLRPQFAYTAGRNHDIPRLGELMVILDHLAKNTESGSELEKNHVENIKTFMEAIVAYLKYVGDRN